MERYAAVEGIRAFDFEDECVVFNPLSWDAHLLNTAAAAVLEYLLSEARTTAEIEAYLRHLLVHSEQHRAALYSKQLLEELKHLGLVCELTGQTDGNAPR